MCACARHQVSKKKAFHVVVLLAVMLAVNAVPKVQIISSTEAALSPITNGVFPGGIAKHGYHVILMNEEFGKDKMRGGLVVRKDSGIENISELKGKKNLFGGGKRVIVGYVANTFMLLQAGLGPNDYKELFSKNPPNATDAAGNGDIGTKTTLLKEKNVDASKLKFVSLSETLPKEYRLKYADNLMY